MGNLQLLQWNNIFMSENTTNILNVVSIRRAIKLPAVAQIGKKSSC